MDIEKYTQVLEDFHAVSQENRQLQAKFDAEYKFAEEKLQEIELFKEFIDSSDDIKKAYDEFMKSKSEEPKEE